MGYSSGKYDKRREERPWKVHPVWRGIGCFLAILMPVMAWAGAALFIEANTIVPLPPELYRRVLIPTTSQGEVDTVVRSINSLLSGLEVTYGKIFFTLVFLFLGFGVLSILYSILYRVMGPSRYSPFDAEPIRAPKKQRR